MGVRISKKVFDEQAEICGLKSPVDVAEKAGLGSATVYRALRGEEFNSSTLDKLATALRCTPIDLIEMSGFEDPLLEAQTASAVPA